MMEHELPSLHVFCEWLYNQPKFFSAPNHLPQRLDWVNTALFAVREFIDHEGKNGKAFLEVCEQLAKGKENGN